MPKWTQQNLVRQSSKRFIQDLFLTIKKGSAGMVHGSLVKVTMR